MITAILNFSTERKKFFLSYLFFLALSIRLCIVFLYSILPISKIEINADYEYGIIARAIADGKGYSYPIVEFDSNFAPKNIIGYRPSANQLPFFPYFLSIFYSFSRGPIAFFLIRVIHAIFSALTCIIIYLIALRLVQYKTAFILGILSAFYPLFIIIIIRIVPETFFTFWLSFTILYLLILKDFPSIKNIAITGLLMGVTVLNNNVITSFFPLIGIWLLMNLKMAFWNKLWKVSLVFSISILVITPWLIRNFLIFNKFPLLKSTTGFNLWIGNNPSGTGTFFTENKEEINPVIFKKFPDVFKLSEVEQDSIYYKDAIHYIRTNPFHYIKLIAKRFYYFWWFPSDELVTKSARSYKKILAIPYMVILIFGIAGIFNAMRSNWKEYFLLVSLMLSISFVYALFIVGHMRYRTPIEPYMLLFASQAIFIFLRKLANMYISFVKM